VLIEHVDAVRFEFFAGGFGLPASDVVLVEVERRERVDPSAHPRTALCQRER
jgi:hypothetical protein